MSCLRMQASPTIELYHVVYHEISAHHGTSSTCAEMTDLNSSDSSSLCIEIKRFHPSM